jgi:hypothetical protein
MTGSGVLDTERMDLRNLHQLLMECNVYGRKEQLANVMGKRETGNN